MLNFGTHSSVKLKGFTLETNDFFQFFITGTNFNYSKGTALIFLHVFYKYHNAMIEIYTSMPIVKLSIDEYRNK